MLSKLKSKAGASMIMALVFLLFCSFVGGSVLTASTANGARIEHFKAEQDYLNQRSAGLLLVEELKPAPGKSISISVSDVKKSEQKVKIQNGETIAQGEPVETRNVTFTFSGDKIDTPMKRVLCETAILRYITHYDVPVKPDGNESPTIHFENFVCTETFREGPALTEKTKTTVITALNQFWNWDTYIGNPTKVEGTLSTSGIEADPEKAFSAKFISSGDDESLYDFQIEFNSSSRKDSQMKVDMKAYHTHSTGHPIVFPPSGEGDACTQVTQTITESFISWVTPKITKGGAGV